MFCQNIGESKAQCAFHYDCQLPLKFSYAFCFVFSHRGVFCLFSHCSFFHVSHAIPPFSPLGSSFLLPSWISFFPLRYRSVSHQIVGRVLCSLHNRLPVLFRSSTQLSLKSHSSLIRCVWASCGGSSECSFLRL